MKAAALAGALVLFFASACSTFDVDEPGEVITYACNDVVAIGQVKTESYTDLSSEDDLPGHGRFQMQVTIKRVLRGTETRRIVPASRIAHGQLVANRDFLLVLSPEGRQSYSLSSATPSRTRPRPVLGQSCQ